MSLTARSGVLHTKSSYFTETSAVSYIEGGAERTSMFTDAAITQDLNEALAYAEDQERNFYHLYSDANNYEDFMKEMRDIFAGAAGDGEKIRSLGNANLGQPGKYIPKDWYKDSATTVTLIIESNPLEIDLSKFKGEGIEIIAGEKKYIQLDESTVKDIKAFLMKWIGEAKFGKNNENGHIPSNSIRFSSNFDPESTADKNLIDWIRKNWRDNEVTREVLQNIGLRFEMSEARLTIKDLTPDIRPFAKFTKTGANESSSIRESLKTEKGRKELQKALDGVKNFILNKSLKINEGHEYPDKGNILKKAATAAWNDIEAEIMSGNESFWFEGRNLAKGLLGAGGEFQVKLINNYLALYSGNGTLGKIIGGIIEDNRAEPRTDVQIIKELDGNMGPVIAGIQVKNVNEETQTHLSVSSDLELIAPNLTDGFRDALANSMFNIDIKNMVGDAEALLKKYVETYFWKAMNLNVHADLNPAHTNTFYFVGGENLVPASKIIREMANRKNSGISEPVFSIKGFVSPSKGDADYAKRTGEDRKPEFLEFFDPLEYLGFGRGAELGVNTANVSEYNKLLAGISINTEFNIGAVIAALNKGSSFTSFLK